MASVFDPYLQWLGIRDPQRPPNHYRLLGLELFENNASVIAMSADRQMAHLRNFKTGPESEVAERLLNELSAARICLLRPERKAAYDNQLRAAIKPASAKPLPVAAVAVKVNPAASMPAITPVVRSSGSSFRAMPAKAAWKPWAILASLVILCGSLVAVLVNKNQPDSGEKVAVAEVNEEPKALGTKSKAKPQLSVKPADMTTVTKNSPVIPDSKTTESSNIKIEPPKKNLLIDTDNKAITKPQTAKVSGSNNKKPSKEKPASTDTITPTDPTTLLGEQVESKAPEKLADDGNSLDKPERNSETDLVALAPVSEPAKPARLAVPEKSALLAKEKEIRDIFADEYKSQKPEVKAALAAKLRQSSIESKGDVAMRFVLLNEARSNAILGGSVKLALEITDELVRDYDLDEGEEQFAVFIKLLPGASRNAVYGQLVMEELRSAIGKLQENDAYDLALRLINMAQASARNLRDPALVTELTQRAKELNLQKTSYQRATVAKDNLAKNANDPAANEQWGAYLSFTKGPFAAGLPFMSRGATAELADLASRELANKQAPSEQLQLADDW